MKTTTVLGIILVLLGIISFAYQGIHYTTNKKVWTWDRCTLPKRSTTRSRCLQFSEDLRLWAASFSSLPAQECGVVGYPSIRPLRSEFRLTFKCTGADGAPEAS